MSSDARVAYRPGYEIVAERILELIVDAGMKPGDRMPTEQELANQIGVTRGVVREAVKLLAAIGRVSPQRGRGLYVGSGVGTLRSSTLAEHEFVPGRLDHVEQLLTFRAVQDAFAAASAARSASPLAITTMRESLEACERALSARAGAWQQADTEFHLSIAKASGNMFIHAALEGIRTLQLQVSMLALRGDPDADLQRAQGEHRAIFDAISSGDEHSASAAARTHVEQTTDNYRAQIARVLTGEQVDAK